MLTLIVAAAVLSSAVVFGTGLSWPADQLLCAARSHLDCINVSSAVWVSGRVLKFFFKTPTQQREGREGVAAYQRLWEGLEGLS